MGRSDGIKKEERPWRDFCYTLCIHCLQISYVCLLCLIVFVIVVYCFVIIVLFVGCVIVFVYVGLILIKTTYVCQRSVGEHEILELNDTNIT